MRDYHAQADRLAPFFSGSPWDLAAYHRKADEVARRFDAERRRAMAEAIRPTSASAAEKLRRVVDEGGYLVTTGQQAGLFTGPLYTVYKLLTAVRLAATLEHHLDRPVAPLFWIASDDHDWQEVNHVRLIDGDHRLRRVSLPQRPEDAPQEPMSRCRLGPEIVAAIDALAELLPETEFSGDLLTTVRSAYRPKRTVAAAFGDLLAELFAGFDLLLVDASHPSLKALSAPVIEREIDRSVQHHAAVAERSSELVDAGYHAQVPVLPRAANVFLDGEHGRERLIRGRDGWVLRRTGATIDEEELRRRLRDEPARFSPNVLLRPVVESAVFPTLAYVAGPGELGYYAQIGCLYREHAIGMPLVYPRGSAVLVEWKVRKVLDKYGMAIEELRPPLHEITARVMREELPEDAKAALEQLRRALNRGAEELAAAARRIDPTLEGPVYGTRNSAHVALNKLEKKFARHLKHQNEIVVRQLDKARTNLWPDGGPQERVLNVLPYLVRYGPDLLDRIAEALDVRVDVSAPAWAGVRCG